jgi:tetratricopeptide (TPR) repeat protein
MQPQARTWPVFSGIVPFLADGYMRRPETGKGPWDGLHPGLTVILGPDGDPKASASWYGGTGKTQLAAAFANKLWVAGELDLLVWLYAGNRDSIVTGYARALADIRVAAPPGQPEAAAARFLNWLADTGRRWLVVLDDLAEPADAEGLWPHGPSGQVLVTTRLAGLSPGPATPGTTGPAAPGTTGPATPGTTTPDAPPPAAEQRTIAVSAFSQREAIDYILAQLDEDPFQTAGSVDLAIALGCLPAGLALAVAYLRDSGQDCRHYQRASAQRKQDLADLIPSDPLVPFWILALDRAMQFAPRELAWPALKLAAVLGPAWIPGAVLTSSAACTFVTGRTAVTRGDQASLRAAFENLARIGLVRIEPDDEVRTVLLAAVLQFSVRQTMTPAELGQTVQAAADAVCESWPEDTAQPDLEQALRDCATSVMRCDEQALWHPDGHPLLVRVGRSLDEASLPETALAYWHVLARRSAKELGARSAFTLQIRERLATAATAAGHADEAVGLRADLAADLDKAVGWIDPQAITARASLAVALRAVGRLSEAISLSERVAADSDLVFGPAHAQTTESLRELGSAYRDAERYPEAIRVSQRCLAVREQTIGLMHAETISARDHLAEVYRRAGQADEAISLYRKALANVENALRAAHPDAVTARENLAMAYYRAGRTDEAAATFERALTEWQRVPGTGPGHTIAARANLGAIYCLSGRLKEAIPLYESELADLERVSGPGHPDTLRARWNLAAACHKAKRLPEAVQLGEATLADCERILGQGHRETLTTRANLAHAYHAAGQLKRASAQFDRALRDCERSLGPDDPLTGSVRALRKRYLAGRQGAAPIIAPPSA